MLFAGFHVMSGKVVRWCFVIFAIVVFAGLACAGEGSGGAVSGWGASADGLPTPLRLPTVANIQANVRAGGGVIRPRGPSSFLVIVDNDFGGRADAYELYDLNGNRRVVRLQGPKVKNVALSPDGAYLAGTAADFGKSGTCEVWSLRTLKLVQSINTNSERAECKVVGFGVGDRVITAYRKGFKGAVAIWDIKTGKQTASFELEKMEEGGVGVSPGGKYVAMGEKGVLRVYEVATGQQVGLAELPKSVDEKMSIHESGDPRILAFSPDGKELAGVYDIFAGHRVIVWDMATGRSSEVGTISQLRGLRDSTFEWLPDSSGWLAGRSLVDRQSGKAYFELPETTFEDVHRSMLSGTQVLLATKPRMGKLIVVKSIVLPKAEIEKTLQTVRAGGQQIDAMLPVVSEANWTGAKELTIGAEGFRGISVVDAAASWGKRPLSSVVFKRPAQASGVLEHRVRGVLIPSSALGQAYVINALEDKNSGRMGSGRTASKLWIDRIDVGTGSAVGSMELPPVVEVLDASVDGKMVAARVGEDRVDVWSTEASGKHVVGFRPYEREEKDGKQVKWAAFVDASHLLTLSSKGRVVLWTIPECQVVYSIKTDGHSVPAVSAGRRYVAVGTSKGVLMFNALTGQSMGKLGDRAAWTSVLSFNPAGTMLACSEGMGQSRVLSVYDLKSGKLAAEVMLPKALRDPGIDWVSPGYVVVGREYLVELERLMVVWRFERPRVGVSVKAGGDERYWYVTSEQDRLMNVALPDEAAKKAIGAVKAEELAVRPGMKVTLEVSTASNDEATRKKVTDALVKRLKENGLTVADGQPVRLVASVTTKGGKEMKYRRMGRLGDETVQTTEFDARLAFEVDGQVAWESQTTGSNAQFFVSAKADESISDVLNRNIPELGVSFLTGSPLPKYVPKPSETVGFGYSKFTSRGVEVAEPPKGGQ